MIDIDLKRQFGLKDSIADQFNWIKSNPKDQCGKTSIHWIAHYMDILCEYSSKGTKTVELGVNQVNSTFAFLNSTCEEVHSVDVDFHHNPIKDHPTLTRNIWLDHAIELANLESKQFFVYETSSLDIFISDVDLLFVDTLHTYQHCLAELLRFNYVNNYIILHDTKLFPRLNNAINDFIRIHTNWKIDKIYTSNPGLTILKKMK